MKSKIHSWFNASVISTLPIFLAVNVAALGIWSFGVSPQAMPLILGIIAGGLVDLDNRFSGRLKNLFYTLLTFSISSVAVELTIGKSVEFTLLLTIMTFVVTMVGAIGARFNTVAFGTLLIALYTTLSNIPGTPWFVNPLLILTGTILYSLCSLFVYLLFPNRPMQENIANAFLALAQYLEVKALSFDPDDIEQREHQQLPLAEKNAKVINAFNVCRSALFYRLRGQHRRTHINRMMKYYFAAQDIHERISSDFFNYHQIAHNLKHSDLLFRIQRLFELQGQACRDLAISLQQNKPYTYNPRLDRAIKGLSQSLDFFTNTGKISPQITLSIKGLIDNLQAVDWQLRHIDNVQARTDVAQIHTEQITGLKNMWSVIKSNFTINSPRFRHAVRLSIVVFICCIIVESLKLPLGYWILLTAILVCQPNNYTTKVRLKQRIIGSLLGVLSIGLLPYIQPTLPLELGLIVLTSSLFFFFKNNNYSYATYFITVQVLLSFNVMGFNVADAMFSRMSDTLIGTFIAGVASSYLWPDWKYLKLDKIIPLSIKANAKYLLCIISQLQFGCCNPLTYRISRRRAQEDASTLSGMLSLMNSDPTKYKSQLQEGFEFLKLNYSLLSYISALGAYRDNLLTVSQSVDFLSEFYPIAKKMIKILESIDVMTQQDFEQAYQPIQEALKRFNQEQQQDKLQFSLPLQQLNLIGQILPHIYETVQKALPHK